MSIKSTLYSSIYLGWYLNNIGFRIKLLTSQKLKYNFQLETRILLPKWYLIFSNNWHLNNGTDLKPFSCAGCQLCCCAIQCNERCIVCLFTCFCHYTDFGASVYKFLSLIQISGPLFTCFCARANGVKFVKSRRCTSHDSRPRFKG